MVDNKHQNDHQHHRYQWGDEHRQLVLHAEHADALADKGDIGELLGQAAGDVAHQILQQIADADGGDHHGHPRRGAQRGIGAFFDGKAHEHRQGDHDEDGHPHRHSGEGGRQIDHHDTRQHEQVAVGEVDELQDAVHHGVADGHQRELSACGESSDQIRSQIHVCHLSNRKKYGGADHRTSVGQIRMVTQPPPCPRRTEP